MRSSWGCSSWPDAATTQGPSPRSFPIASSSWGGSFAIRGCRAAARPFPPLFPDCFVLGGGLVRDPRVPRRRKALLLALAGSLVLPFDLVPDFIPVAGQLDDAVVVALVLRSLLRGGGEPLIRELWPGSERTLALVLRLAR